MGSNNKYKKNYYENKNLSYLTYLDKNDLYGWGMSQKSNGKKSHNKKLSKMLMKTVMLDM